MASEKHQQKARAVYHDWRERALQSGGSLYISHLPALETAIAAALEATERETAQRAIIAGESAVHLPRLDDGEDWCQAAVDAACETRNQYSAAIRAEFGITEKEKER